MPEVKIPEGPFIQVVSALTTEVNRALAVLRSIASGRDLKKFLIVCTLNLLIQSRLNVEY